MKEKEEHFEGKIHQNAVVTTKARQQVLLVRDPNDVDLWELPGGRLNLGEEPVDGVRREIMEEIGIEVEVGGIYHTQYLWHMRDQKQNFLIMYEVFVPTIDIELTLDPEEVDEVQWVDRELYKQVKVFEDTKQSLDAYFAINRVE